MKTLVVLILSWGFLSYGDVKVEGVSLSQKIDYFGKEMLLNGSALRKATIFSVKVYIAGLYLEKKSTNPKEILDSQDVKIFQLHPLMHVDKKKVTEVSEEGMKKNCGADCDSTKAERDRWLSALPDFKKGDIHQYEISGKGVIYKVNDKEVFKTADAKFGHALLASWLGDHPPTEEMKKNLLGILDKKE